MTGNEKLRKENQSLRNEIAELKEKLQKISEEFLLSDFCIKVFVCLLVQI